MKKKALFGLDNLIRNVNGLGDKNLPVGNNGLGTI